jgi:RNA polymerase sigma-70 factor (ECF subfamily)
MPDDMRALLESLYRIESGRILATLIRLLGDFDRAEEALHEALHAALASWPVDGVPENPVSWLISAGRFKGIDRLRKSARADTSLDALGAIPEADTVDPLQAMADGAVPDDHLRLIFICCHPSLTAEARAALTLREVCGLTTEDISRAFLATPATIAQRIVRAKNKIKDERLPYEVPSPAELPDRLGSVLQVIYLVFNEGYAASAGDTLARPDLSGEALRLGRLLHDLLPAAEVKGLLALMLLQESRRHARTSQDGALVLLDDQDRALWDRALIEEGLAFVAAAFAAGPVGPYALQAAIAAVHAQAATFADTDWRRMVALYDLLLRIQPSPVVGLNRAVAVAMRDGPEAGLVLLDELRRGGKLDDYQFLHSARAELCRRLGRIDAARAGYERALTLAQQGPERRFLESRLRALG